MTGGTIAATIAATPASDGTIAGILARIGDTIAVARGVTIAAAGGRGGFELVQGLGHGSAELVGVGDGA